MEKLRGYDYIQKPLTALMEYDDFSPEAMQIIGAVMGMTTEQLEQLDISGVMTNG